LYEFTFERECSSETLEGGAFQWEEGDAVVYILDDDTWSYETIYPSDNTGLASKPVFGGSSCGVEVGRVSGVIDHTKKPIGRLEWDLEVDLSSGKIVSVDRKEVRDGVTKTDRYKEIVS
jgi:hypothetical protein